MSLRLYAAPSVAAEPLQVGDLLAWLRDPPEDDSIDIQRLISAARQLAERENGRILAVSTWERTLDEWPDGDVIELLEPLVNVAPATTPIVSFTYKDSAGTTTAMVENADYIVDANHRPGRISLPYNGSWPSATLWPASPIKIRFTAGMAPENVPDALKQFMGVLVTGWYEKRIPFDTGHLVSQHPFVAALAQQDALIRF